VQVAQFLDDRDCVSTLSEQIARVLRNATRRLCSETASSAQEALSCLPGLAASAAATAAAGIASMPVFNEFFKSADGGHLGSVLEQLSLVEMAAFPENVRVAALSAHSPQQCLQLAVGKSHMPFDVVQNKAEHQSSASFQMLQGFAPLIGLARVQSLVLSNCGMKHEHVQVRR
jgi:hypothetical protein